MASSSAAARRFRSRPTPYALMHTLWCQRRIAKPRYPESDEHFSPINRIIFTILREAILAGTTDVKMASEWILGTINPKTGSSDGVWRTIHLRSSHENAVGRYDGPIDYHWTKGDLVAMTFAVSVRNERGWSRQRHLPEYAIDAIRVWLRDMAGLPVSGPSNGLVGRLSVENEGMTYTFDVREYLDRPGQPIIITQAAA